MVEGKATIGDNDGVKKALLGLIILPLSLLFGLYGGVGGKFAMAGTATTTEGTVGTAMGRSALSVPAVAPAVETAGEKAETPIFRLHLSVEPLTLDPTQQRGSGAMFLMNALQQPLFISDLGEAFRPGILKSCHWRNGTLLNCKLQPDLKWSNGERLEASAVVRTFDYFRDPKSKAWRSDLIVNIKNVTAKNPLEINFELQQPEPHFQERLSSPLLAPIYSRTFPRVEDGEKLITSGPYKIEKWDSKRKISLVPNPFFKGHPQRPKVEFYFIPEDTTALMLYEKGQLDFLRRLPSPYWEQYKTKPDFHQLPLIRFDYVGFGPMLAKEPELRKILARSINFEDWKSILQARGRPGCFGIGLDLLTSDPCLNFNTSELTKWRAALAKMNLPKLELHYSTLGGEDNKRSMEWLQNEWNKNLGLNVKVKGLENAFFQREMNENPAPLFRFGVSLEHLSCHSAIASFMKSPESPLPFKQEPIQELFRKLGAAKNPREESLLCRQTLELLLKQDLLIPLGRIHISLLARPTWEGWRLTPLNYLDLSQLHAVSHH